MRIEWTGTSIHTSAACFKVACYKLKITLYERGGTPPFFSVSTKRGNSLYMGASF